MAIPATNGTQKSLFCNPTWQKFSRKCHLVALKTQKVVVIIFQGMRDLLTDSDALYYLLKLAGATLLTVRLLSPNSDRFEKFGKMLNNSEELIEQVGLVECVCELVRGDHKKDTIAGRIARIALFAVNILGLFALLDQITLIDLGKVAETIGSIKIFAFVSEVSLGVIMQSGLIIYYTAVGADAIIQIVKAENSSGRLRAALDLSRCIAEVVLRVFIIAGGTCVPVIIIFTTVSASLGIVGFFHGKYIDQKTPCKVVED